MPALDYQHFRYKKQVLILILLLPTLFLTQTVFAKNACDEGDLEKCEEEIEKYEKKYESTSKQLDDIKNQKNSVTSQISNLSNQLYITQGEIDNLKAQIDAMTAQLEEIKIALNERREQLKEKIGLRNRVVRNYYQTGVLNSLEMFFTDSAGLNGFQYSTMSYMFNKSLGSESIRLITALNKEIGSYEKDQKESEELKKDLEGSFAGVLALQTQLANQKTTAESEANALAEKEGKVEGELKSLSQKINDLNEKQRSIIAAKSGEGDTGTVGDYDSPKWTVPDAPFDNAYAAFSYGAYTHYNGMSQYGAKARADDGDSYKDIIDFYYDAKPKEKDIPDKIKVQGHGEMSMQKYLYGLAEMPSDWNKEALKAQAVAARSYAYRYVKADKEICTSQSCQVFSQSKSDNPPSRWKDAVDDTEDELIDKDSGSAGYGWYSSTTGGYINDIGWDVDGKWPNDAYEKKAKSPWFYWAWWTQGTRFDGDTCGGSHPWLESKEMADIVNSWIVWSKGSESEQARISPVTTSCWDGDPYSLSEMKEKAGKHGDSYSSVSDTETEIGNDGITKTVKVKTDKGWVSIPGQEFKTVFNLRAPRYIAIKSRLFEMKRD